MPEKQKSRWWATYLGTASPMQCNALLKQCRRGNSFSPASRQRRASVHVLLTDCSCRMHACIHHGR